MYKFNFTGMNKASYFRPDGVHLSYRGFGLLARLVLIELGK
jgi:hypothetical protein